MTQEKHRSWNICLGPWLNLSWSWAKSDHRKDWPVDRVLGRVLWKNLLRRTHQISSQKHRHRWSVVPPMFNSSLTKKKYLPSFFSQMVVVYGIRFPRSEMIPVEVPWRSPLAARGASGLPGGLGLFQCFEGTQAAPPGRLPGSVKVAGRIFFWEIFEAKMVILVKSVWYNGI